MAWIRFEPSGIELEVLEGVRLVDLVDEHPEIGIPFSCRDANCGTCAVVVNVDDEHAFIPPDAREHETLRQTGASTGIRLGCQLRTSGQHVELVVLRTVTKGRFTLE